MLTVGLNWVIVTTQECWLPGLIGKALCSLLVQLVLGRRLRLLEGSLSVLLPYPLGELMQWGGAVWMRSKPWLAFEVFFWMDRVTRGEKMEDLSAETTPIMV